MSDSDDSVEANSPNEGVVHASIHTATIEVSCPHCDRQEPLEEELSAYAWVVGHIQTEHADELPDFKGVE